MIYTARQLEDLHRGNGNGQLVLPYGARLTPLAADWAKAKRVAIGYGDVEPPTRGNATGGATSSATTASGGLLWWCDGPCGVAKAAIAGQAKESSLSAIEVPADAQQLVKVIKRVATEVKGRRASGGVLLVQSGAAAVVLANRCPSLRAILGTSLESVEQGIQQVAANVLVIEYPNKTLSQVKSLLGRFARAGGARTPSDEVVRELKELASCE
jgi:ribose 5-phosphate isomerase RpiB